MQIQVAIIDDIVDDAIAYRNLVAQLLDGKRLRFGDLASDVDFSVEAIYPHPIEDGGDFLERVERFLLCEAPFVRYRQKTAEKPVSMDDLDVVDELNSDGLHVVILDHYLMPASRAGIDRRTGINVAEFIRRFRPNVQRLLLSSENDTGWPQAPEATVETFFNKNRLLEEPGQIRLVQTIHNRIDERLGAPYWKGLQAYAGMPKIVMHAMAITDAGSLRDAGTAHEFLKHFGSDMFIAEASLILDPLDSVFAPQGSLKRAMALYAKTFAGEGLGARCYFVTNGTSTSNKIVTEAVTNEGDLVILDRNCHISHHFAYVNQALNPIWLEPEHDGVTDVSGAVTPEMLSLVLDRLLNAGRAADCVRLPSLITITNCSFDGFLVDPVAIINATIEIYRGHGVLDRLQETVFLFDEAWFGFARFHPATASFSASHAMRHFHSDPALRDKVRIYATTSVHKTMSALRQASTILAVDPLLRGDRSPIAARFAQAYSNHTTTSPHAAMISSIDIARRQIDVEGTALLSQAISAARAFERALLEASERQDSLSNYFKIADLSPALASTARDPTKVLVQVPTSIGGAKMKQLLWEKARIQINKFSRDTVLFMFMIGFDNDRVDRLLDGLRKAAREIAMEGTPGGQFGTGKIAAKPPSFAAFLGHRGLSTGASVEAAYLAGNQFAGRAVMRGGLGGPVNYVSLANLVAADADHVAAGFVTPYPPGYPVLVPSQLIDADTAAYLRTLDNPEIHGTIREKDGTILFPVIMIPRLTS